MDAQENRRCKPGLCPPSLPHFQLPSLLPHKGPAPLPTQCPLTPGEQKLDLFLLSTTKLPLQFSLPEPAPDHQCPFPKGTPLPRHPKLPTSHLPPPSTLPPTRKSEFVVEVKSDKLPEEMALLQGSNGDKRAPGDQVGGSS